jgi:RNA polymerase sigma factor (sigma-70 family)
MDILSEVCKRHNEWVKIVTSFGTEYAEDIVQEMYLKLHNSKHKNKIIQEDGCVNTFYIWVILRNLYYDLLKSKKINYISIDNYLNLSLYVNSEESYKYKAQNKIEQKIQEEVDKWHWYDIKMFNLYRESELSMREIAKETGISITSIFNTLKNCKGRLREAIGEDFEDYLNEDFELIK